MPLNKETKPNQNSQPKKIFISLILFICWLGFMAYQPFVDYLTPNPSLYK